jgi:hypothetical protein
VKDAVARKMWGAIFDATAEVCMRRQLGIRSWANFSLF